MCGPVPLALLAVALAAAPVSQQVPAAPTGVIAARAGQVLRFDGSGTPQVLLRCEVHRHYKLLVAPYEERSETLPCFFTSLATHESSGRWAVGVSVSEQSFNERAEYLVDGKALALPPKAGGNAFVLGDARGVTGTSLGAPGTWSTDGKVRGQYLEEFSADGKTLYFQLVLSGEGRDPRPDPRWQLAFDGPGRAVQATPSERTRARGKLAGVVGGVLVDAEAVYYYRKGKTVMNRVTDTVSLPACDPAAPGSWRRLDRKTGRDDELLKDGWCITGTAPFVGVRAGSAVVLNQLGQDRVRRLYRHDPSTRQTTPIALEGVVKTPMAVSADGAFVLALTYRDGLAMYETATGALVWKAVGLPPAPGRDEIEAAFVSDGAVPLAHPRQAFLGDGRAIPVGAGDPTLTAAQKLKSFFERAQFGTAHLVSGGVHLAELSSMDAQDVEARLRSDVRGEWRGWSLLAAWPAAVEQAGGRIAVGTADAGGCRPFSTAGLESGRLVFLDWRDGRPEVVACAVSGHVTVRGNDRGGLELDLDVTLDDGATVRDFRVWLAPVR